MSSTESSIETANEPKSEWGTTEISLVYLNIKADVNVLLWSDGAGYWVTVMFASAMLVILMMIYNTVVYIHDGDDSSDVAFD